jgi:ubiquinone/menaquinone biosynthesis C-methylase UbiE
MKIVDVGCATGDFTRHVADLAKGNCKIIGVDTRTASLRSAEKETATAGLAARISYRKGDAYKIPVKNNWADLTCCRTVLMHLTDPLKAVQEMTRITRPGGTVAAVEPGRLNSAYIPDEEQLTKLALRLGNAYLDGVRKLEGKYYSIGERLPTIFHKAGLREIKAEVQADAYLTMDPRRRLEDVRDELGFYLEVFKQNKKLDGKAMRAGGASKRQIDRYSRWYEKWAQGLLKDDQKLRDDTRLSVGGMFLVAGRKTAPN